MNCDHVSSRLKIRDKITNPITAKIASNPGIDVCDSGVDFTVGDVVPDVSVPSPVSSLCDGDSEVDVGLAPSLADCVGVGVGEGVGVDMDTAPVVLPPIDDVD